MKKKPLYLLLMAAALLGSAGHAFAVADPAVNGAAVNPSPIVVPTGISVSFQIVNAGTATSSTLVKVTASLLRLKPASNFVIGTHITGPGAALFTWTYDAVNNTFTGTLNQNFAQFTGGGMVNIGNLVSTGTSLPGAEGNGLNVNVATPGAFNASTTNDNISAMTSSSVVLPVQFASFGSAVSGCDPVLSWETGVELNVASIKVQRSADGTSFATIGSMAPKGSSSSYIYKDKAAPEGKLYYRLMSVDQDGSTLYSDVETLVNGGCGGAGNGLVVYPNPGHSGTDVHVKLTATAAPSGTKLLVTDIAGRVLSSQAVTVVAGVNHYLIPTGALAAGTYLVRLESTAGTLNLPSVKLTLEK